MRQRLNESYELIFSIESRNSEREKEQVNDGRTQDSQVGNG